MAKSRTPAWRKRMRVKSAHRKGKRLGQVSPWPLSGRKKHKPKARADVSYTFRKPADDVRKEGPAPALYHATTPAPVRDSPPRARALESGRKSVVFREPAVAAQMPKELTLLEFVELKLSRLGETTYGILRDAVRHKADFSMAGYRDAIKVLSDRKQIRLSRLGVGGRLVSDAIVTPAPIGN